MKYQIKCRETGDLIDEFDTRRKAEEALSKFIEEDEILVSSGLAQDADPMFYEIVEIK